MRHARSRIALAWLPLFACGTSAPEPVTPAPAPPALVSAEQSAAPETTPATDSGVSNAPPLPSMPPAAELLRDGFADRHAERALPLAGRGDAPPRTVVAQEPGRTRLIVDDPSARVLVWAEDAALRETPLAVTPLTRQAAKPSAREQVLVGPGAFVERKSEKNGFVRVSAHDRSFRADGYLPAAALGRVYVPASVPEVPGTSQWVLASEARVLGKPGGTALGGPLDASPPAVQVTELSKGAGWFVEIAYRSPTLSVRGFVPKSALSPPAAVDWGVSYGSTGQRNPPEETLTFARGACLYAEPWGEVIGVLRLSRTANVHIEEGARAAWRQLELAWTGTRVWLPREGASTTPPPKGAPEKPLPLAEGFSCAAPPKR